MCSSKPYVCTPPSHRMCIPTRVVTHPALTTTAGFLRANIARVAKVTNITNLNCFGNYVHRH